MRPTSMIVNDLIANLSPVTTMPVGGPPSSIAIGISSDYAVEVRALGMYLNYTAGAGTIFLYVRAPGVGDVFIGSFASASPAEFVVPLSSPIVLGRGWQILLIHAGAAVTIAGTAYARMNGVIIPD